MGLLDGMLGNVINGALSGASGQGQGGNPLLQLAMTLLQDKGGLSGIVDMLTKGGLGQQASSWVGTGDNLPVNPDQISQALGDGTIADLAAKMGMSSQDVSGGLAQYLPDLVNKLTPEGHLPDNENVLLSQGLDALRGKLFG